MTQKPRPAFARLIGVLLASILLVAWAAFLASPPFGAVIQLAPLVENVAEAIYVLPSDPAALPRLMPLLLVLALVIYPPVAIAVYAYVKIRDHLKDTSSAGR